jgi:hypothetical protein
LEFGQLWRAYISLDNSAALKFFEQVGWRRLPELEDGLGVMEFSRTT